MSAALAPASAELVIARSKELKQLVASTRLERRVWITWTVFAVILACDVAGIYVITLPYWWAPFGALLAAEAMILSWYLSHDCAHRLAFQRLRPNLWLGEVLSVINGTAVFAFRRYRQDHLRHHAEQVDLVGVHVGDELRGLPRPLRAVLLGLEAIYIPAVFAFVRLKSLALEIRSGERWRAILVTLGYLGFYAALGWISPLGLFLWFVAVSLRIHCVRFVDAFQHTYDHVDCEQKTPPRGFAYEQRNTFSFPVAKRFRFLNLLLLNFGFHNAHHAAPNCPWYALPRLDAALRSSLLQQGAAAKDLLTPEDIQLSELLAAYNAKRLERILAGHAGEARDAELEFSLTRFRGAFTDNLLG